MKPLLVPLITAWLMVSCGGTTTHTNEPPPKDPDPEESPESEEAPPMAVVHVTDYFSSALISVVGNLESVGAGDITTNIVAPLPHTDAALRSFDDLIYIINRLGRDSIQVVDPADDFNTIAEFSTGGGTNPQDILVLSASKAYLTLYQPEAASGTQEVIVVNPQTGVLSRVIDLTGLTDDDGERLARPTRMIRVGSEVWVLIQDLDVFYQVVTAGKIAVIDTATDQLVDTDTSEPGIQGVALAGHNPNDLAYDEEAGLVFVTDTGVFGPDFMTDTSDGFGGIETIDPESYLSSGIIIDDALLGGYLGRIQIASGELGFTTADSKRVVSFNTTTFQVIDDNLYESPGTFLPEILLDGDGHLLITERGDDEGQGAGLVILDIENNFARQGPLDVGGPPSALTIIQTP